MTTSPQRATLLTNDGLSLYTVAWLPQGKPRAVVFIVHGYAEHIMRYQHVADALVDAGFAVYGHDHRGHGQSEGVPAHFDDWSQPIDDLYTYYQHVTNQHPAVPYLMYGHSMGTLISLEFALRHPDAIAALALSGSAVTADETVADGLILVGDWLAKIAPKMTLVPALPAETLTTDEAIVRAYEQDPLIYRGKWRAGMGSKIIRAGRTIRKRATELMLPLLFLHGEDDLIAPVSGSHYLYQHATSPDKTLHTYAGMRHEIMNEIDYQKPLSTLIEWFAQRS